MKIKLSPLPSTPACFCILAVFGCLGSPFNPAHAEGSKNFTGAQGVNRVIRSQVGAYTTTSATGTMSFSNVPAEGDPFDDKPSFYLEGTVGINEIDAGLQYEPRTIDTYKPGWAAFISIARGRNRSVFCNPKVVERSSGDSIAWRGGVAPTDGKAIKNGIRFTS